MTIQKGPAQSGNERLMPRHDMIPCWYMLSTRDNTRIAIEVLPKALFAAIQKKDWGDMPTIKLFTERFGFNSFTPPSSGNWGFDSAFSRTEPSRPGWIAWCLKLPKPDRQENPPLKSMLALRCTLNMFCFLFTKIYGDLDNDLKDPQLLVLDRILLPLDPSDLRCTGGFDTVVTPAAASWINKKLPEYHEIVVKTMRGAYAHMWGKKNNGERFGAELCGNGGLFLQVPGDAANLYPDSHEPQSIRGYKLTPHNVDNSYQQLTLIAGLAKLHDLMREHP